MAVPPRSAPRFTQANTLRWARMPGVVTGHYAWCVAAKAPLAAHAYKTKVRAFQALCGAPLAGGMAFPGTDAVPCARCMQKAAEMEQALARTPRKQRDEAAKRVRN